MIDSLQLLHGCDYRVNDYLSIHHPMLSEICDCGEQAYYRSISSLCATPSDYKSMLWDNFKKCWEDVDEFEFFATMKDIADCNSIKLLFGDFPLKNMILAKNNNTSDIVLYDPNSGLFLDRVAYMMSVDFLRTIHGITKNCDKAGNHSTMEYLINKDRRALSRRSTKNEGSNLALLVSSMVNCEHFKYDYSGVWDLHIYQFMDSVRRIRKLQEYNHLVSGVYAGTVDTSKISKDAFNWMGKIDIHEN